MVSITVYFGYFVLSVYLTFRYYNLLLFTKDQDQPLSSIDSHSQNSQTLIIEDTDETINETSEQDHLNQVSVR